MGKRRLAWFGNNSRRSAYAARGRGRTAGRLGVLAGLLLLLVLSVGCVSTADPSNIQERANEPSARVTEGHSVGQTFVSHYEKLSAVQVLPVVEQTGAEVASGKVIFHLRASADSDVDLAALKVDISELGHSRAYKFEFPALPDSRGKTFYFVLDSEGVGGAVKLSLWKSTADSYLEGAAYVDGQRQTGDLVFQTFYSYGIGTMLGDVLGEAAGNARLLVSLLALFVLPGYALLILLGRPEHRKNLPLMIGLSVSIVPVLVYYATLVGVRLDSQRVVGFFVVLALVTACYAVVRLRTSQTRCSAGACPPLGGVGRGTSGLRTETSAPTKQDLLFYAALAFVLVASAVVRVIHLRDLVVPMWVDSVQHVEMAQLIVNRGGVPDSYRPFADVAPFSYHFGFHALIAALHWLSGAEITTAVLFAGQALNFAMVLMAYLLGARLMGGRLAGLASASAVGLFSTMPAYYTTWGRYTQLTGLVVLPIAMVLALDALEAGGALSRWRALVLAAPAIGGLIIAHPRVTVFFLCFLVAHVLVEMAANRRDWRRAAAPLAAGGAVGVLGIASVAPWFTTMASSLLVRTWEGASAASAGSNPFPFDYFANWADRGLIALAAAGFVFAIGRRNRPASTVALWSGLMLLSANPNLLGLPGGTMVSNGAVAISLFLPISLLVGHLVANAAVLLRAGRWPFPALLLSVAVLIGGSYFSAARLAGVMNPSCILFVEQDQKAMDWIRENTPADSTFLVNSRLWQFDIYVGTDGGYWIPALTGRRTTMPSLLYALSPDSLARVNSVVRQVSDSGFGQGDIWSFLKSRGISYIYIGYRGGVLTPEMFIDKAGFRTVYERDGVWVFEVGDGG